MINDTMCSWLGIKCEQIVATVENYGYVMAIVMLVMTMMVLVMMLIFPTWHFEIYDHTDLEQQFEHTQFLWTPEYHSHHVGCWLLSVT